VFPTSFHHTNHHAKPHPNLPIHPRIVQVSEVPQLNPVYPDQFHDALQLTPVKPPPYVPKKSPSPHYGAIGGVLHPHDLHHDELHDPRPPHAPQGPHHPHDSHHSVPQHKKHYKPIVTKAEIPAKPGCKAYSTKTCKKIPTIVAEKIPVPHCYNVPRVDCFHVLKDVPDLHCHPKAVEDCIEIVKQVPYFAPEEYCKEEPREECVEIDEEVPVVVCRTVDPQRASRLNAISNPYTGK